jgi:hypothetical protein
MFYQLIVWTRHDKSSDETTDLKIYACYQFSSLTNNGSKVLIIMHN